MLSSLPIYVASLIAFLATVHGFVPVSRSPVVTSSLQMMVPQAPPPALETFSVAQNNNPASSTVSPLQQGVESYLSRSTSVQVALQERKIPTKEEIEAKKRNFNVIFWGRFAHEHNDEFHW
jgi:hypothetical protein